MFFEIQNELNEQVRVYVVVGKRNVGKTYSTVRLIRDMVKEDKDNHFIYMRRYIKTELDYAKNKVFANVEDCDIHCDGYVYKTHEHMEDDKKRVCGYAVALSSIPKGIDFEKVKVIIFDEFVITDNKRYLTNEFETFANFLETAMRLRNDCIVIMLGNAKNFYNPYTVGWNITLAKGQKRWTGFDKTLRYYLIEGDKYDNKRSETTIGKLFSGTAYDEWADGNNFTQNNDNNILKKQKNSHCYCKIITDTETFTIWTSKYGFIVSNSAGITPHVYHLDFNNLKAGEMVFKQLKSNLAIVKTYAMNGLIFYESRKIKNSFYNVFNYIVGY